MTCVIVLFHCYDGELSPISDTDREIYLGINYFFATLSRLALCWFFAVSGFLLFRDFDLKKNYGNTDLIGISGSNPTPSVV